MKHVVLAGIFLIVLSPVALSQTTDVTATKVKLKLENTRVDKVLVELAVQCGVSIGFERSDLDGPEIKLSIDESQSTIKDVLNHIVKEVSFYKWELRDGVINFVPVRGRSRILEEFLSIHVREYKASSDLTKFDLRNRIYDLPEVELFLKVNNIKTQRLSDYPYNPSIYAKDVDLSIAGTNVLGILNNIVANGEHHLWTLSHRDGTLYLSF